MQEPSWDEYYTDEYGTQWINAAYLTETYEDTDYYTDDYGIQLINAAYSKTPAKSKGKGK